MANISVPSYESSASRIEFCCVRCLYAIPLGIVGGISALIMMVLIGFFSFLNMFTVVIMGNRIEALYNLLVKYNAWSVKVSMYFGGVTDERPPLSPFFD